jgi:uncharacterized protein (TIGR00251 family)
MVTLNVKVVPGSSRNRIAGRYGDGIRVQVSAPPEKGRANEAVIQVLAAALGVPARQIELASGQTQPRKSFRIATLDAPTLAARLQKVLESP